MKIKQMGNGCGCGTGFSFPTLPNLNTGAKRQTQHGIKAIALVKCSAYGAFDTDIKIQDETVWTAAKASNDVAFLQTCEALTSCVEDTAFEARGGCGAYVRGKSESTLTIEDDTDNATYDRAAFYASLNDNPNGFYLIANFCSTEQIGSLSGLYKCAVDAKSSLDTDGVLKWTLTFKVMGQVAPKYNTLTWDLTTI